MRKASTIDSLPKLSRRRALGALIACAAAPLAARAAESDTVTATDWPMRPIRIVASTSAGTSLDALARMTAACLSDAFGQPAFVENHGGAAGNIATDLVSRASPDGHTLLFSSNVITTVRALLGSRAVDPVGALAPITIIGSQPLIIVAHSAFAGTDFADVIRLARATPGQVAYATSGVGSLAHLTALWAQSLSGIRMLHVPYAASQSFRDVLTGEVPLGFTLFASAWPVVRSGQLKAIAITARERSRLAPDVRTLSESGLPGFDVLNWQGLLAPAGTSPHILLRLNTALVRLSRDADADARLRNMGYTPVFNTPAQFADAIRQQTRQWTTIVQTAGLKVE